MRILIAGSHGQVGEQIARLLSESEHTVHGMVHNESYASDIEALGVDPVVADLTEDVDHAVRDHDAIIFAAGSSGEDVWGVDRDGAINIIEAAEAQEVERFVMLSSINADTPEESPDALRDYLVAKAEADDRLRLSDLTHTIVRPGPLTNEKGTGHIQTGADLERDGDIPREDVAQILVTVLDKEGTYGTTFEVLSGDTPIADALVNPV